MANFKIVAREGSARVGVLTTGHGEIQTPTFMPVGTQGSVKALSPVDLIETKSQIILGNTYHLFLRPGSKLVKKMGGLHKFMDWDGPILTDSGGFQAFSLGAAILHKVKKIQQESKVIKESDESEVLREAGGGVGEGLGDVEIEQVKGESANPNKKNYRTDTVRYGSYIVDNREKFPQDRENKGRLGKSVLEAFEPGDKSGSVKTLSRISEDGILFTSHLDGSRHLLTPEKSIEVQLDLGSDIVLVLDELLSPLHSPIYVEESLQRTHRWEMRSKKFFDQNRADSSNPKAQLYGIVQGVYDREIREGEARWIAGQGFDGISIGGSCGVSQYWPRRESEPSTGAQDRGESKGSKESKVEFWATKAIYETMGWVTPLLPDSLPRHALGIGEIVDFFECIDRGIDMFDCVSPTRRARNGSLYVSPKNGGKPVNKFVISIQRAEYTDDNKPIDPGCECYACQNFSRAYLRHLYISSELLYHRLASIHNVHFFNKLLEQIRQAIMDKQFQKLKKKWLD